MKRIRILYVILAALLVASVGPLLFYALKMLSINRGALETNENLLQSTITRSIAGEISIYNDTFHQLLDNLMHLLEGDSDLSDRNDSKNSAMRATLERFVGSSDRIIYVTLLDAQGRGIQAGSYNVESDPFLVKVLERGFAAAQQLREYQSDLVLIPDSPNPFPAMLVSRPLLQDDQFHGMIAVVLNLRFLVDRLQASSTNGLEALRG